MGSIHQRIVNALALEIVQGQFRPGQTLPIEPELMERYGASRSAVREAVRELAAKGLVETRRRTGTFVRERGLWHMFDPHVLKWLVSSEPEEEFLANLIELRQIIEPAASRFAAMRATLSDIGRIDQALRDMDAQLFDGGIADREAYDQADVTFHLAIFGAAHNPMIEHLGLAVRTLMMIGFKILHNLMPEDQIGPNKNDDHHNLLGHIQSGDPEGAARAAEQIIIESKVTLVRARRMSSEDGQRIRCKAPI